MDPIARPGDLFLGFDERSLGENLSQIAQQGSDFIFRGNLDRPFGGGLQMSNFGLHFGPLAAERPQHFLLLAAVGLRLAGIAQDELDRLGEPLLPCPQFGELRLVRMLESFRLFATCADDLLDQHLISPDQSGQLRAGEFQGRLAVQRAVDGTSTGRALSAEGSARCRSVPSRSGSSCTCLASVARTAVSCGKSPFFAEPRKSYPRSFTRYVLELLQAMTIRDLAAHLGVVLDLESGMVLSRFPGG